MSARIATTQWSQVLAVQRGGETEARQALEALCRTYWQPVYAFIRHLGSSPDEASDLTQAYFTTLLERDFLSQVDAERGRFRAFLYTSVRHFLSHERDKSRALKRGGGTAMLPLDIEAGERGYAGQPRATTTPEDVFEHRWAMTVLSQAMRRLEEELRVAGKASLFDQLQPYLTSGRERPSYRHTAAGLGMSEGAVKVAVHRLRRRFGACLRAVLAETVGDQADVDDELRHLLAILGR